MPFVVNRAIIFPIALCDSEVDRHWGFRILAILLQNFGLPGYSGFPLVYRAFEIPVLIFSVVHSHQVSLKLKLFSNLSWPYSFQSTKFWSYFNSNYQCGLSEYVNLLTLKNTLLTLKAFMKLLSWLIFSSSGFSPFEYAVNLFIILFSLKLSLLDRFSKITIFNKINSLDLYFHVYPKIKRLRIIPAHFFDSNF